MNIKAFFVINIYFSVLSCIYTATTMLRNGDIIEIETINPGNGMSNFEVEALKGGFQQVLQAIGSKQPVTIEIVSEEVPNNNNYGYNRYGQRPMQYRPPAPPDGYAHGRVPSPGWNPPPPHPAHQYPPTYNPYNTNDRNHGYQQNQGQQTGNSPYVITKQPSNPNYPEFEIYTVDVTDGKNMYPNTGNNLYPNGNNGQNRYPNMNNGQNRYPNMNNGQNRYPNGNTGQNRYPNGNTDYNNNGQNRYPNGNTGQNLYPNGNTDYNNNGQNRYPNGNTGQHRYPNGNTGYDNNGQNRYPNGNTDQNLNPNSNTGHNHGNGESNGNQGHGTKDQGNVVFNDTTNEANKSEEVIKDKVDAYLDRFPVILLKENEIRRR